MRIILFFTAIFVEQNLASHSAFAQQLADPVPPVLYRSNDIGDYFTGYFTPPDPATGNNFRTCTEENRLTDLESVSVLEPWASCDPAKGPYTFLSASEFVKNSIGSDVFALSGIKVGYIEAITVDDKGALAGFLLSSSESGKYQVVPANSISGWDTGGESPYRFLLTEGYIPKIAIETLKGDWLTPEIGRRMQALTQKNLPTIDLLKAIKGDEVPLFSEKIGVYPVEMWQKSTFEK